MSFSNHPLFRFSFAAALCFLSLPHVFAQTYSISGKVTDAISREPIPFASIFLQGKSIGTNSDFEGNFTLQVNTLSDSLVVTSIGYQATKKPLKNLPSQTVNFILERAEISLQEILIRPTEDPAVVMFRKIIKNKERNSNNILKNYSYEAYNKVELDLYDWNDKFQDRKVMRPFQFVFDRIDSITEDQPFLPVFLSESLSDYYYRSEPQTEEREVIVASKQSGIENESFSQFLGSMYQEVSVYDNWPSLFYKSFVSPVNDNGLSYYKYSLVDSGFIDGVYCYQMTFAPKTQSAFTFVGDMWIADSTYAIKQVSMEASKHVNINFIDKMSFFQQFELVNDSLWMLSKDKLVIRFKMTENMLGFIGRKTASYKDFQVDRNDMEQFFTTRTDIVVDEKAFEKPDSFWTEKRHEELTLNESGVYEMVDSLKNTRAFKNWLDVVNMVLTGYYDAGWIELGPIASAISFNDVENVRFRLGFRTSTEFSKRLRLGAYGAYGIDDKRFKWGAEALFMIAKDPRQMVGVEYSRDLDLKATSPSQFTQDNFLTGLIRRNVPQRLSYVKQGAVFYEKEWKVGYANRITLRHRDIVPEAAFAFQYVDGTENGHSDTLTSFITSEATVVMRFAYREKFLTSDFTRVSLGTRYPTLIAVYTLGVKNILGSDFTYHKIELALNDNFPVNPIGTFNITLVAGKTFGTLPFLLLNVQPGNETFFYNRFAFNLMNRYEFVTDMYAALHLRHHFEGYFLNKIPGVRKLKLREIIFANAVIGTMSDANKEANALHDYLLIPFPKPYIEVGFGIENIFKLFEVDFMWRLTYRDAPYAPAWAPMFGMKLEF